MNTPTKGSIRTRRPGSRTLTLLGSLVVAAACGSTTIDGPTATVRVTVYTQVHGTHAMPSGYTAFIEDRTEGLGRREERPIGPNGSVDFTDIGSHRDYGIGITGVPDSCEEPAEETVTPDSFLERPFSINCWEGTMSVLVYTAGDDLDPDGYEVVLDGTTVRPVGVGDPATATFPGMVHGEYTLALQGLAANCAANPASMDVLLGAFGPDPSFRFDVFCEVVP